MWTAIHSDKHSGWRDQYVMGNWELGEHQTLQTLIRAYLHCVFTKVNKYIPTPIKIGGKLLKSETQKASRSGKL